MTAEFEFLAQGPHSATEKYALRKTRFGRDDVLPLWVADMDFPTPSFVTSALHATLAGHPAFGYPILLPEWREAVVDWHRSKHRHPVDPNHLLSVPAVISGIVAAVEAFTLVGDGVIVMPPIYRPLLTLIDDTRRNRLECPLMLDDAAVPTDREFKPTDDSFDLNTNNHSTPQNPQSDPRHLRVERRYRIDWSRLETLLPKAKALLLCSPHNPGGRTWTQTELCALAERCADHGVRVIADEIHMDLVHSGGSVSSSPTEKNPATALSTRPPNGASLSDNVAPAGSRRRFEAFLPIAQDAGCSALSFTAPGKTFNTAGIGGAYAIVPNDEDRKTLKNYLAPRHPTVPSLLQQSVLIAAYRQGHAWTDQLMNHVGRQITRLRKALAATPIELIEPEATYLAWLDCRGLGLSPGPGSPNFDPADHRLRRYFIDELGLGLSEGVWFSDQGHEGHGFMRINLATTSALAEEACLRLERAGPRRRTP